MAAWDHLQLLLSHHPITANWTLLFHSLAWTSIHPEEYGVLHCYHLNPNLVIPEEYYQWASIWLNLGSYWIFERWIMDELLVIVYFVHMGHLLDHFCCFSHWLSFLVQYSFFEIGSLFLTVVLCLSDCNRKCTCDSRESKSEDFPQQFDAV